MKNPELAFSEAGTQYSEWVIGEYNDTTICPYRIVRMGMKEGRAFWESPDCFGDDEDVWMIKVPDAWHPINVARG